MTTPTYSLYYAPGAASLVVHWLLIELGVAHELRLVDTKGGEQKRPEYLALNPNGVVPTLVVDGQPMYEAAALLMTLADRHPQAGLAPALDDPRRAHYYQWMLHLANAVQPLFRIWWYPHEVAGVAQADAAQAHVRPRIEAAWERLDAHLAAQRPVPARRHRQRRRLLPGDADALVAQRCPRTRCSGRTWPRWRND